MRGLLNDVGNIWKQLSEFWVALMNRALTLFREKEAKGLRDAQFHLDVFYRSESLPETDSLPARLPAPPDGVSTWNTPCQGITEFKQTEGLILPLNPKKPKEKKQLSGWLGTIKTAGFTGNWEPVGLPAVPQFPRPFACRSGTISRPPTAQCPLMRTRPCWDTANLQLGLEPGGGG